MRKTRNPNIIESLIPLSVLAVMLASAVVLFGDGSSAGPNQISLLLASGVAAIIGIKNGLRWADIEAGIVKGIAVALPSILILLAVGSLIGTWLLAGTVPTLIYYGLKLISPDYFYFTACLLCAIVAMSIGSSWTVAATVGVALIGVADGLGLERAIAAGAVVSGAYFGDKMSPLSETTNLAPAVAGTDLFTHIRHMIWTSVPSIVLALIIFLVIGLGSSEQSATLGKMDAYLSGIEHTFTVNIWMLIPLLVTLAMAIFKVPAFPAVAIGALLGGVWAWLFQGDLIHHLVGNNGIETLKLIWRALFDGVNLDTGNAQLNELVSGGGMSSMLNTVWLILSAMAFGAVMEITGLLQRLVKAMLTLVRSTGSLIVTTLVTCFGTNVVTADQYISIVVPGRMFRKAFEERGLAPQNLSRTLEDCGTITSPLIPWNSCGAYMQSVLMVSPADYFIYAFFNWTCPLIAALYGYIGFKIVPLKKNHESSERPAPTEASS